MKLKGLPEIYYLNLDERPDRVEYTETQYEKHGITKFRRWSASEYQLHNFKEWRNKVRLNDMTECKKLKQHIIEIAISMSTMDMLRHWYENSTEPYVLLMEDDYDLQWIDYWHFDWEYLMNHLPFDWDCIQLSFENEKVIPCFLHPIHPYHCTGAALINRPYAEKLIRLLYKDGKYDFSQRIQNYKWGKMLDMPNRTIDYFLCHAGRTYSIPLISLNPGMGSYSKNIKRNDRPDLDLAWRAYNKWWKELRDDYSLEEFFMFGKPNDRYITRKEPGLDKY